MHLSISLAIRIERERERCTQPPLCVCCSTAGESLNDALQPTVYKSWFTFRERGEEGETEERKEREEREEK